MAVKLTPKGLVVGIIPEELEKAPQGEPKPETVTEAKPAVRGRKSKDKE